MPALVNLRRRGALAWLVLRLMVSKFGRDNGLFLASGLAFSLLLYSIPLALIMISVLGYTVLESEQAMEEVQSVIRQFLPRSQEAFVENVAAVVADRGLLGMVGFGSFLVFSTTVFGSIRHVLNIVFQAGPARSLLRGTAQDFLMMVFCIALLFLTIGVASLFTVLGHLGDVVPWGAPLWSGGLRLAGKLTGLLLAGSLIMGLYRFSPARTLSLRSLAVGAIVMVVLFELARQAFALYVEFAQATIALYGVLGAFLFFFLWLYYASVVFVLGAEVGWAYEQVVVARRHASVEAGGFLNSGNQG